MLRDYRVLDCTDDRGHLAGLLLAQLGADVILVEPPEGSPARRRAPFAGDRAHEESSLWHWAYNRGKRSAVVDWRSAAGKAELLRLAADADVLLWSGRPADAPAAYDELEAVNPGLVVVAYTPWGLDGPKAGWADSDIVICASACQLAITGDADRPPLRCAAPQGHHHGAADAAVAALIGLHERRRSGRGQLADVSAQASYLQASFSYSLNQAWRAPLLGRSGEGVNVGAFKVRWGYPAKDGEVSITLLFGAAFKEFTPRLFRWIWEEGFCDEETRDLPFEDLIVQLFAGQQPPDILDRLAEVVAAFCAAHTKDELFAGARARRVLLAPVHTPAEVVADEHLGVRGYWDLVAQPGGDGSARRHPGRFVLAPAAPLASLGPAPRLGEHTAAVLAEPARPPAPAPVPAPQAWAAPFDGLKVLDLSWSIAGPYVGRCLAEFGAQVVRVESQHKVDVTRTVSPIHPLEADHALEGGGTYSNANPNKLGVALDLSNPASEAVVEDLVRWADVVLENFSPGALDRMGYGYERLRSLNPAVILLSSSLPGRTGPLDLPGYGNLSSALFGFHATTRWPDRLSAGPFGAYTDTVSPRFGVCAVLAALDRRDRTGLGLHLDLSQAEASLHFLAPTLLDAEVNGREFEPIGNADPTRCPHGVYPARGEDRWVAAACETDEQWAALAGLLGREDLAGLDAEARVARRSELDALVAAWTSERAMGPAAEELQRAGVPAHQVQNSPECLTDPQLAHRGHYVDLEHPLLGPVTLEGVRIRLSRTPGRVTSPGPTYGQHTFEVLSELLGYADERIGELAAAEVFE
ncbi:MAG: CoA transferase [Acidimicrobiales bacterium]